MFVAFVGSLLLMVGGMMDLKVQGVRSAIDRAVAAEDAAERASPPLDIAWIGGSEVELDGRSLPAAMERRLARIGDRPIRYTTATTIGPSAGEVEADVRRAVRNGADVLVVSLSISWLTWEDPMCDFPSPDPVVRYVCVLSPTTSERADRLQGAVRSLIDTVVASGIPAYVYSTPHSTDSLNDPRVADLIAAAERGIARLDPELDRVEFVPASLTRGRPGFDEPEAFFDMVHPTELGIERIAAHLEPRLVDFVTQQLDD